MAKVMIEGNEVVYDNRLFEVKDNKLVFRSPEKLLDIPNYDYLRDEQSSAVDKPDGLEEFYENPDSRTPVYYDPKYFAVKYGHLRYIGTSEKDIPQPIGMTKTSYMFYARNDITSLNLEDWDMSKVTDTDSMFNSCTNLKELHIQTWETFNIVNMDYMFCDCKSLENLNLNNWITNKLESMKYMFSDCCNLTTLRLAHWNVDNVKSAEFMFLNCTKLNSVYLYGWKIDRISDIQGILDNCDSLHNKYETKDAVTILNSLINEESDNPFQHIDASIDFLDNVDTHIYYAIPESTRHLYGDTPEEVVKNYLKEHTGEE